MAETREEVLVSVVIDNGDSQGKIDNLTRSITSLTAESKKLTEANQQLAKEGKENTQEYVDNARQLEINKQKIAENTASRKGLTQAIIAEDNSVKGLKIQNAELIKQRDQINTKTKDGQERIRSINKQIDDNNSAIKANVSGLEKQKMGIGDYTGALDKMVPGLGATVNGIKDFTAAGLRLLATPVGLILLAIAAALASVALYFKRTEEGADSFAKILAQGTAVLNVLLDRLAALGGGLVALFSGNFEEGIDKITHAFDGMGKEMKEEATIAGELAEALDALEDRERSYNIEQSRSANEIKKLMLESKNRLLTEQQKIDKLKEALAIEQRSNATIQGIRRDQLSAALKQFDMDSKTLEGKKRLNETEAEYLERILASNDMLGANTESKDALAEAVKALNEVEGESLNLQEKIINMTDAQILKQDEKRKKDEELFAKFSKEFEARLIKEEKLHDTIMENADKQAAKAEVKHEKETMAQGLAHVKQLAAEETQAHNIEVIRQKLHDEEIKRRQDLTDFIVSQANKVANTVGNIMAGASQARQMEFKNEFDAYEVQKQNELAVLKKQLADGLISEEDYKKRVEQVNADFDGKQREVKRKAFEDNKKNNIAQARIDQAQIILGAIKSMIGVPLVGQILAAAAAAAQLIITERQIDAIKDSVFVGARGGSVTAHKRGVFHGKRHSAGGINYTSDDGHRINVEDGEAFYVLNRTATREIAALSALNEATGGVAFSATPSRFGNSSTYMPRYEAGGNVIAGSAGNAADLSEVVRAIEALKVFVAVTDINDGQSKHAQVVEAAELL